MGNDAVAVHGTATFTNTTVSGAGFRGITTRFGGTATITHSTIVTVGGEDLFAIDGSIAVGHSILVAPAINGSMAALTGTFKTPDAGNTKPALRRVSLKA